MRVSQFKEVKVEGLGKKIKEARYKCEKSIEQLCAEVGISRTYWYEVERETIKGTLSIENLNKMEEALGVSFGVSIGD